MDALINFQHSEMLEGITVEGIKSAWEAATPGPWRWFNVFKRKLDLYLATTHSGHLVVMDFVRKGMQDATVRVRDQECLMHTSEDWHGGASGDELHPDLFAIEQAPAHVAWLLMEVERLQAENTRLAALVPLDRDTIS